MSLSTVNPLGSSSAATSAQSNAAITSQLGPDAFLKLLTTELANQNPLNPVDQTQSLAQLAQFSALQSQQNLASSFQSFQSNFAVSQASGLLGKTVQATVPDGAGNSSYVTGIVQAIQVVNGVPQFTLVNKDGSSVVDAHGKPISITQNQIVAIK